MKAIKGSILFCFLAGISSSCFDPPVFSDNPSISFNKIEFKITPNLSDADSLILYIDFRDGNGDMGLDDSFREDPFHERNFYYENVSTSSITSVGTVLQPVINTPYSSPMTMILTPASGKLVTNSTRNKPGYSYLPAFNPANTECRDYTLKELLIAPTAAGSIDATYNIIDTLYDDNSNEYYVLRDTVYFTRNLNYYNIRVRFYESSGGAFTEFSWEDEFCTTLNGRFPILSDDSTPLEGTIRYAMPSVGFVPLFSIKTLMLDVIVSDRKFSSDSLRTPEFTLDKILIK